MDGELKDGEEVEPWVLHPLHWVFSRGKREKEFKKGKIVATNVQAFLPLLSPTFEPHDH